MMNLIRRPTRYGGSFAGVGSEEETLLAMLVVTGSADEADPEVDNASPSQNRAAVTVEEAEDTTAAKVDTGWRRVLAAKTSLEVSRHDTEHSHARAMVDVRPPAGFNLKISSSDDFTKLSWHGSAAHYHRG